MKRFWLAICRTLSVRLTCLLVIELVFLGLMNGIAYRFGLLVPDKTNTAILGTLLVMYGATRVIRFHPVFNSQHLMQVTLLPWQIGKDLPRGPVHLNRADAAILLLLTGLTFVIPMYHWSVPLIIFLAAYNLALLASFFATEQGSFIGMYLLLVPLTVYPHLNPATALAVLIVLTAIGLWGVQVWLKGFPWNTPWWTGRQIEELKQQAFSQKVIQWPFRELSTMPVFSGGLRIGFFSATLFFIYAHVINWSIFQKSHEYITDLIYILTLAIVPMLRLILYITQHQTPISFFGRFSTGRLIIPGYDKVFVGPVLALLAGLLVPPALRHFVASPIAYELGAAVCVFVTFACPPNYQSWHYTGQHRLVNIGRAATRTLRNKPQMRIFRQPG